MAAVSAAVAAAGTQGTAIGKQASATAAVCRRQSSWVSAAMVLQAADDAPGIRRT